MNAWKYIVPGLALAGVALGVVTVMGDQTKVTPAPPIAAPPTAPYTLSVAGAGLIEPSTEPIAIGTHAAGVVAKVLVKAGYEVKAGDVLFTLDDRAVRAELASRRAALDRARAELDRLRQWPRPEEVRVARASVDEARVALHREKEKLERLEAAAVGGAASLDEIQVRRFDTQAAEKRLAAAQANLDLLSAGAWQPEIAIAEAQVAMAQRAVEAAQTDLDRLMITAPRDATVLRVSVRAGEFADPARPDPPLMVLGDTHTLHVRADIDENDAWRIRADAPATAMLRGNRDMKVALDFVRIEPMVQPKKSLTGDTAERIDTRVMQVVYAFPRAALPAAMVGQQVDVYVEAGRP
jgi:multidrug resistance efflux pump